MRRIITGHNAEGKSVVIMRGRQPDPLVKMLEVYMRFGILKQLHSQQRVLRIRLISI